MVLMPTRRPTSATTIGRLIATSEPNAMASTTTATRIPIFSLPGAASPAARPRPWSYSTWTPASRATSTAFSAASKSSGPISWVSNATVANAVVPSLLTVGPRGS